MQKRIILITGTPCVGKTRVAKSLASLLKAFYVNLTELAMHENLVAGEDQERDSIIIDEKRMQRKVREIIRNCDRNDVVIDGHYASSVIPKKMAAYIFVLRRSPIELRKLMEKREFSNRKLWENLASEILDVCLVNALNAHEKKKVCELDATGKSVEEIVSEILEVLSGHKKCHIGIVDWLGKLESEGLLEEYLRV